MYLRMRKRVAAAPKQTGLGIPYQCCLKSWACFNGLLYVLASLDDRHNAWLCTIAPTGYYATAHTNYLVWYAKDATHRQPLRHHACASRKRVGRQPPPQLRLRLCLQRVYTIELDRFVHRSSYR